jgi:hypothetical protein
MDLTDCEDKDANKRTNNGDGTKDGVHTTPSPFRLAALPTGNSDFETEGSSTFDGFTSSQPSNRLTSLVQ